MGTLTILNYLPKPIFVWLAAALVLVIFGVVSIILIYHWKNYSFDLKAVKKIMPLYFGVAALFIFILLLSAMLYTL